MWSPRQSEAQRHQTTQPGLASSTGSEKSARSPGRRRPGTSCPRTVTRRASLSVSRCAGLPGGPPSRGKSRGNRSEAGSHPATAGKFGRTRGHPALPPATRAPLLLLHQCPSRPRGWGQFPQSRSEGLVCQQWSLVQPDRLTREQGSLRSGGRRGVTPSCSQRPHLLASPHAARPRPRRADLTQTRTAGGGRKGEVTGRSTVRRASVFSSCSGKEASPLHTSPVENTCYVQARDGDTGCELLRQGPCPPPGSPHGPGKRQPSAEWHLYLSLLP